MPLSCHIFSLCKYSESSEDSSTSLLLCLVLCRLPPDCEVPDVSSLYATYMQRLTWRLHLQMKKTLGKFINQMLKKNHTLNQHGVNAAYKSLHYCKSRRYCNYPQVLWSHSKMHSLVKCTYPDVKIKLRPFLNSIPRNSIHISAWLSHFLKYSV